MSEGDFWNNLDSFVEQKKSGQEDEKVGDWLDKSVAEPGKAQQKSAPKTKSPTG